MLLFSIEPADERGGRRRGALGFDSRKKNDRICIKSPNFGIPASSFRNRDEKSNQRASRRPWMGRYEAGSRQSAFSVGVILETESCSVTPLSNWDVNW